MARCFAVLTAVAPAVLGALVMLQSALPAAAQAPSAKAFESHVVATPRLSTSTQDQASARRIELQVGNRSSSIFRGMRPRSSSPTLPSPNAVVRSNRKIYVIGVTTGTTSIFINDAEGKQIAVLDMSIARELGRELSLLRNLLKETFPRATIEVRSVGNSFILSGTVDSALEAQRAVDIATSLTEGISSTEGAAASATLTTGTQTSKGQGHQRTPDQGPRSGHDQGDRGRGPENHPQASWCRTQRSVEDRRLNLQPRDLGARHHEPDGGLHADRRFRAVRRHCARWSSRALFIRSPSRR